MSWSKKPKPPVLADISIPAFVIKTLGSRHILVAGGGGAAATGVSNELQVCVFLYFNMGAYIFILVIFVNVQPFYKN